jgi:hypothetical protein
MTWLAQGLRLQDAQYTHLIEQKIIFPTSPEQVSPPNIHPPEGI